MHLSGKGSWAARYLLEAQQTGTVCMELVSLLGSYLSAWILHDHDKHGLFSTVIGAWLQAIQSP